MENKFEIGKQQLAEMAQIAVTNNIDTSKLSWTEVQQTLTLFALEELFKRYQLDVPYKLSKELTNASTD